MVIMHQNFFYRFFVAHYVLMMLFFSSLPQRTLSALGADPIIKIKNNFGEGITAECESEGWSSEPYITWKDSAGNTLTALTEENIEDSSGVFTARSSVAVLPNVLIFCIIRNNGSNGGKSPSIFISDYLDQHVNSCWEYRLKIMCLEVSALFVPICLFWFLRNKRTKCTYEKYQRMLANLGIECRIGHIYIQDMLDGVQEKSRLIAEETDIIKRCLKATMVKMTRDPGEVLFRINVTKDDNIASYIQCSDDVTMSSLNTQHKSDTNGSDNSSYVYIHNRAFEKGIYMAEFELSINLLGIGVCTKSNRSGNQHDIICAVKSDECMNLGNEHCTLRMYLDCDWGRLTIVRLDNLKCIHKLFPVCKEMYISEEFA